MPRSQTRLEEVKRLITSYERKIKTRKARIMELDTETRTFKIYLQNLRTELFNLELTPAERARVDADNAGFRD